MIGTLANIDDILCNTFGGVAYLHIFKTPNQNWPKWKNPVINLPSQGLEVINIIFQETSATWTENQKEHRNHGTYYTQSLKFFVPKLRFEADETLQTMQLLKSFSYVFGDNDKKFRAVRDASVTIQRTTKSSIDKTPGYQITINSASRQITPEINMETPVNYWADPSGEYYEDNNTGLNWIAL